MDDKNNREYREGDDERVYVNKGVVPITAFLLCMLPDGRVAFVLEPEGVDVQRKADMVDIRNICMIASEDASAELTAKKASIASLNAITQAAAAHNRIIVPGRKN
jgi:hypothetical protein